MDRLLAEMRRFAADNHVPIISPEGAVLLARTVASQQPRRIVEVGTAIGYSTLLMAAQAPAATILSFERDPIRVTVARDYIGRSPYANRITVLEGDAAELLGSLSGQYDLVFIDAAKGQYLDYLLKLLANLTPGAVIISDNVLFRGWVTGNQPCPRRFRTIVKRLRQYLDFLTNDDRFTTTVHPVGDGVAISYYQGAERRATT